MLDGVVWEEEGLEVKSEEGVVQGDPLSSAIFAVTMLPELQELDLALRVHSGMARAGADDTFVVGPPIAALEAVTLFVLSLKQNLGLSVNATKSQIFC